VAAFLFEVAGVFGKIYLIMNDFIKSLPSLTCLFIFVFWWMPRDPSEAVLVAEYEPPRDQSPAEAGRLMKNEADPEFITTEIINLAVNRHIRIEKIGDDDYLFKKVK
jgi:hypothetical protein